MENEKLDVKQYIQEKYLGKELCQAVGQMDAGQLSDLISLVITRWQQLHPDTEFCWFGLPKYDTTRHQQVLKQAVEWLEMGKEGLLDANPEKE